MIGWIKRIIWRRKLENNSTIVIEKRTISHGNSSSSHSLLELRDTLEKGDFDKIVGVLENELKISGVSDNDVCEIMENLNEEKIRVIIKRIGLLSELERRETEKHQCTSSSPIS